MILLLGGEAPRLTSGDRKTDMRQGRELLVLVSGKDFGYDPRAWHKHLRATNAGGYRWSNKHLGMPKRIEAALGDESWQRAARELQDAEPGDSSGKNIG